MAKLPVLNQRSAIKLLEDAGWRRTKGGKHVVKMVREGHRPITLPASQAARLPPGLTAAILRQAGLRHR